MKKLLTLALMAVTWPAFAGPIDNINTTIYGDPRTGNPDGIELIITGQQRGANESIFDFNVDFTPVHDAIHGGGKLLQFYFNVNPDVATNWVVDDVTAGYTLSTPATVNGAGGTVSNFLFELTQAPPNSDGVPLNFSLQLVDDFGIAQEIMEENFTNAPDWESTDSSLNEGQIGAHVGDLAVNSVTCPQGGCSDSGFAVGDWGGDVTPDPQSADAPGMVALLSIGLIGLYAARKRA